MTVGIDSWSRAIAAPARGAPFLLVLLLLFLATIATRIGLLNLPALFDEFYHLLPARSLNEGRSFGLLDGEYTRGAVFTRGLALHLSVLGEDSLYHARLFPLFFGAAVPLLLFAWLNRHVGWLVAAVAAALAVFWPGGIYEAQTVRFYSAHVLAFLFGSVALYEAVLARGALRLIWAAAGIAALLLALSLQMSTIIGAAAIGLWFAVRHVVPFLLTSRSRYWVLALGITALVLILLAFYQAGFLQKAWAFYRWVPAHSEAMRDDYLFYHDLLMRQYGLLWIAFPIIVFLAIRRNRALGLFCAILFATAFLTHSFGAFKAPRYISYVMPFLFALQALGLVAVAQAVFAWFARRMGGASIWAASAGAAVMVVVLLSGSFIMPALKAAMGKSPTLREDWSGIATLVGDWDKVPFRITTRELDTIAYLGDYDLLISRSRLSELPGSEQFAIDYRTGRPVISDPDVVNQILRCVPDGLIIATHKWWNDIGWQDRLADTLSSPGVRFETRSDAQNFILHWQSVPPTDQNCDLPLG